MIFLSTLLIKGGFFSYLINKFKKIKTPLIIFLTIILGAPSSLILLNDIEQQNIINKNEKELLFTCFGGISFSFLISLYSNSSIKHLFIIIYYTGELLIYLFFKNRNNRKITIKPIAFKKSSIRESIIQTLLSICSILFFSLCFNYLFAYSNKAFTYYSFLTMFLEFSYSSYICISSSFIYKDILIMLILSFTSLSLYFQIYYFDSSYDLINHIKKRWLISTINSILLFIFI